MRFFLWIYVANIMHRVRWLGVNVGRLSLFAILLGYLSLAQPMEPMYSAVVHHYINLLWLCFGLSFIFAFVPSESFVLSMLAMYRRDEFMQNSIVSKIARLIKYFIKHDLLGMQYSKSIYRKLVNNKRVKLLCWAMYGYDVYKGFKFILNFVWEIIVLYFGFVCATWLYVYFTHANLYYYRLIHSSMEWVWAVVSFLILKILLVPSFSAIRRMIGRVIIAILRDKFGVNRFEDRINNKLAMYEKEGDAI